MKELGEMVIYKEGYNMGIQRAIDLLSNQSYSLVNKGDYETQIHNNFRQRYFLG